MAKKGINARKILIALARGMARRRKEELARDAWTGESDPDPENWRTINGSHVHLSEGKIDGGAGGKFEGKNWNGKTPHKDDRRDAQGDLFSGEYRPIIGKSEKVEAAKEERDRRRAARKREEERKEKAEAREKERERQREERQRKREQERREKEQKRKEKNEEEEWVPF